MSEAHWISPDGYKTQIYISHIRYIKKNPTKFGLTPEEIEEIYDGHTGATADGVVEDQIMKSVIKKGWIRTRKVGALMEWVVHVDKLTPRTKNNIWGWAIDGYDAMRAYTMNLITTDRTYRMTFKDLVRDGL